ncbi:S8 family serine peptidase [Haloechinothrix salitolerans]|uniref:S8 family serine peptidase n=1 Tax=Haloechinothrix salitolerans TaxID=926830 RepID=A0ABW2C9X5_9PSEU
MPRGVTRVGALVAVALFTTIAPGLNPAVAVAQDGARPPWAPAGEPGSPPSDPGKPDKQYKQRVKCVQSGVEGHTTVSSNQIQDIPWGQAHLRLDEVHDYVRAHSEHGKIGVNERTGKPLKVAVIDTGVTKHPYLQNRVTAGGDYVQSGDKGKNGLLDCDGHGTQVAGIIGANPKNPDIGFIGVAPDVQIISIRQSSQNFSEKTEEEIKREKEAARAKREAARRQAEARKRQRENQQKIDELQRELEKERQNNDGGDTGASQDSGQRTQGSSSGAGNQKTLAQAIVRAVNKHNVDVINMSVDACRPNTGSTKPVSDEERMLRAAVHYATERDVVVVAAAGNTGGACQQNGVPIQGDPRVTDPNEPRTIVTPPWFSEDLLAVGAIDATGSVADFSMHGPWVSVAAPGTDIISLDPAKGSSALVNVMFEGKQAVRIQGTSFAAPYVAGLAVLVRQMHPELTAREVMHRITTTAQHPGAGDGRDPFIGHGVINPMAALTMTLPEEIGAKPARDVALPSSMPPPDNASPMPVIVALAGSGGGLLALGCTMFAVHTVRRNRAAA